MSGVWTDEPRPLPLDMRVLGAMLVAHGVAAVTVERLAEVLNMSAITINAALMRMLADGVVCNTVHGGALFWGLADDFTSDVAGCPRMGKVVAFPSGDAR